MDSFTCREGWLQLILYLLIKAHPLHPSTHPKQTPDLGLRRLSSPTPPSKLPLYTRFSRMAYPRSRVGPKTGQIIKTPRRRGQGERGRYIISSHLPIFFSIFIFQSKNSTRFTPFDLISSLTSNPLSPSHLHWSPARPPRPLPNERTYVNHREKSYSSVVIGK